MNNRGTGILVILSLFACVVFIVFTEITDNKDKTTKVVETYSYTAPKPHDYVLKFSGDHFEAKVTNAEIELHGGAPSFDKGFKISVPSELHFTGTEIKCTLKEPKGYMLGQLYKDGKLIYEQDTETIYRGINLLDLNIGKQE